MKLPILELSSVQWCEDRTVMNCKGFEKMCFWFTGGTVLKCVWKGRENHEKPEDCPCFDMQVRIEWLRRYLVLNLKEVRKWEDQDRDGKYVWQDIKNFVLKKLGGGGIYRRIGRNGEQLWTELVPTQGCRADDEWMNDWMSELVFRPEFEPQFLQNTSTGRYCYSCSFVHCYPVMHLITYSVVK